jgi:hypothetical protein
MKQSPLLNLLFIHPSPFSHLLEKLVTTLELVNELKLGGHVSLSGVKLAFGGIPSLVFVLSRAHKYMRMHLGILLSLFRPTKKEPPGVSFMLFSDSLNMKRLSSDLASFPTH